jgi:hypothetical protein
LNETLIALIDKYLPRKTDFLYAQGLSWTITEQWSRFDALLKIERDFLYGYFTEGEQSLMLQNALSKTYDFSSIPGAILVNTQDEEVDAFETYGVDRAALLKRLEALNIGQQFALVDWLEELRIKKTIGGFFRGNEDSTSRNPSLNGEIKPHQFI